jgi:4-amino-4-deoxy-L-arabinose transferase-like glycosyltransferase
MTRTDSRTWADQATRIILAAGFLLILAANLPGHLSFDSIVQLHEGRFHVRVSWAPAMYAWILGLFDRVVPGTGLYVCASAAMLFCALMGLRSLRPRTSWAAPVVALAMLLTPQLLVYQGIVWKDVLLANLGVAAFVCLAHAANGWSDRRRRFALVAAAVLMLSVGALIRQNGVILVPLAALAVGWTARREGWRRSLTWGGGVLIAALLAIKILGWAVEPKVDDPDVSVDRGVRIVQQYDIVGAVKHDPTIPLGRLAAARPSADSLVRNDLAAVYSPERVDTFDASPRSNELWLLPASAVSAQWFEILIHHPGAYLAHRAEVFGQLILPPIQERCLPVWVGVDGPAERAAQLNLALEIERSDQQLANYATWFYYTPIYSHLAYGLLALAVLVLTLMRRDPADYVIAALMAGVLGFTASFAVISLACDYRYLYLLDLAAMAGLFYLALDPPFVKLRRFRR